MILKDFLLFLSLLLIYTHASFAKKHIVPNEYSTIQKAIDHTEEGDTVYVLNGKYSEKITIADNIVLLGQSADKTILTGNNRDPVVKAANHSVIRNFTIKNGGIGILSENTNMLIQNNVIRDNQRTGIQCLISLPQIQNNIIIENKWSGIFCELVSYGTRTAIEHNVIADNEYSGINLSRQSGVLIQNNIFYNNRQFGVFVSKDSRKSRIIYNNFYGNRRNYNPHAVIDATNVSVDPQFPSRPWANIHLFFGDPENQEMYHSPLRNLGKNGAVIGLVSDKGLKTLFKDSDEDGIADDKDRCPDMMEDFDGYEDSDGCPDYDNDNDGIYDTRDKCPDQAEDFDGYIDQDGCPDLDNDEDGILDSMDKCPNQKETVNGYKDEDGCPDVKQ